MNEYEIDHNAHDIDKDVSLEDADEYSYRHGWVIEFARSFGFGYRRNRRD